MTNRQIPDRFLYTTNIIDTTFAVNFFMQFELTFRLKLKCARYGKERKSIEYHEVFAIKHTGCTVGYEIIYFLILVTFLALFKTNTNYTIISKVITLRSTINLKS